MDDNLIDGPINVVRLEGKIFGITKILYVFMDYHSDVEEQTKCPLPMSKTFIDYVNTEINKTEKDIDFFLEINEEEIRDSSQTIKLKEKYIQEIMKFFRYMSIYDKNKNIGTKIRKNVRFHWIDPRYNIYSLIRDEQDDIRNILLTFRKNEKYDHDEIMTMMNLFIHVDDILNFINQQLEKPDMKFYKEQRDNDEKHQSDEEYFKMKIIYNINKIKNNYGHTETWESIKPIFNKFKNSLEYLIKENNSMCDMIENFVKSFDIATDKKGNKKLVKTLFQLDYTEDTIGLIKFIDTLYDKYIEFEYRLDDALSILTDLYFLRRFIDKDYVNHSITYTGIDHSIQYIFHLVKNHNMKITNVSYVLDSIDFATETIKKNKDVNDEIMKLFYPPTLLQCSDMKTFPEKFD